VLLLWSEVPLELLLLPLVRGALPQRLLLLLLSWREALLAPLRPQLP
jgi:hypothetical protein